MPSPLLDMDIHPLHCSTSRPLSRLFPILKGPSPHPVPAT